MVAGLTAGSLGILTVALAPNTAVVLLGWCIAQVFFNALLAAMAAVMPDQVPTSQRGIVSGILAICLPVASVVGTFLVQLFDQNVLTMLLVPCAVGGVLVLLFAADSPTGGSTPTTARRGRFASSSPRSTSTPAAAPTSHGRSPAGSC